MSELSDRLNRLAARGNRRGADDVLAAAIRDVPDSNASAPDVDSGDLEIIDGDAPFVMPDSERRGRGRYGTLVATFGAAALLGVGVLAVTAMFGNGGSDSPEGAVRQLAEAISHKDPLAAVDVLVPSEVRSMRENVNELTHRAADLKIVDQASQPLAGVDFAVNGLKLSSQNLADGYAKVTITGGQLSAGTHRAAMSQLLQDALRNSDYNEKTSSVELAKLASDVPTFVIAVKRDGGWYISPAYTALEYARQAADGPPAQFGSAQAAKLGSDTPELAVSDALHALQAGDWERLMALAPPDELPVYDYRAWILQEAADAHPGFTIDKLTTSASVSGDTASVKLEASGTAGSEGDQSRWQVGGTCSTSGWASYSYDSSSTGDERTGDDTSVSLCVAGNVSGMVPFGMMEFDPQFGAPASGAITIRTVRENGRWYVSPVATVLDAIHNFVGNVDERSIYPLLGLGYKLPPDGTIALNQPFGVTGPGFSHVYAFDGKQGQSVVGQMESSSRYAFGSGQLYTADGKDVGYVDFAPKGGGYGASTTELPVTGSYRLVLSQPALPKGATLTLFDTDHAPKSLLNPDPIEFPSGLEECLRMPDGSESCSSSGSATPTTVLVTPLPPPESGCVTKGSTVTCSSQSSGVTETTVP